MLGSTTYRNLFKLSPMAIPMGLAGVLVRTGAVSKQGGCEVNRSTTTALLVGLYVAMFAVSSSESEAQSDLPPCPEDQTQRYDSCFGTYLTSDGAAFVGEWKDDRLSGQGTYTSPNGYKYAGEYKDGKRNGQGTETFADGTVFIGEWRDNKRNGQFTVSYADGAKYIGEFKDDIRHGQGTLTYASGDKYAGEFKDDQKHGQGTYTFADGEKYVGEWRNDVNHGQGTYSYASGDEYVGEFKDGKRSGQGTFTYRNGDKYIGEYRDGERNGQFTVSYANGDEYVGEFKDNQKHGQGTYSFADGTVYVGALRNNKFNGRGTYSTANGDEYVGEFEDDVPHGQGTYTFANSNKYVGEWKDGKRNGRGTRFAANGSVLEIGLWENDVLVKSDETSSSVAARNPDPELIGEVRGWSIVYLKNRDGACAAYGEYRSGTTVVLWKKGGGGEWMIEVSNPKWSSIKEGEEYDIKYVFSGRRSWSGGDVGIENGFQSDNIKKEFIEDFARSSRLEIRFKDKAIDQFSLRGTRAAVNAVEECYKTRVENTDPFASDDPFASSSKAIISESGMCSGTITKAPVKLFGGEHSDYYKIGDREFYITQYGDDEHGRYFCSWGGSCIYNDYIELDFRLKIRGNPNAMSGVEIKENSFESEEQCTISDLDEVQR